MGLYQIKMDNAAISAAFVLSFNRSSDFVAVAEKDFFLHKPIKERRAMLRDVYKIAKRSQEKEK